MIDETLVEREAAALMSNYRRQPVAFVRGEGAVLYDAEGRAYLDCMAGISMTNVGHSHPEVVRAITEQAARLVNVSNLYYTEPMIELAEWIRDNSLGGRVYLCNSGAEASEAALKLARKHGGPDRPEVVALVDGFHGRTYGALSLTGQPSKQDPFRPLVPGVIHVDRDDLEGLRAAVGERTCAIFLEVIQGEIGVRPVPQQMIELARDLADRHGALLVFDEIQTGLSRTGTLFAYQGVGVEPDVMCLAKSLGAGVPIGAVVARPGVDAVFQPGDHGSAFAGGPLACAAAVASCRVLGVPGPAGARARHGAPCCSTVCARWWPRASPPRARGRGLMCANRPAAPERGPTWSDAMLAAGYLINNTTPRTLRFLPPLVVDAVQIDGLVAALRRTLTALR